MKEMQNVMMVVGLGKETIPGTWRSKVEALGQSVLLLSVFEYLARKLAEEAVLVRKTE